MYKLTTLYKQLKEEEQAAQVAKYKIFCDMDGVLCDFDRRFEQFAGMSPKEYESKFGTKKFWEIIDKVGNQFWSKMPWMPDGKELWTYISKYKPVLLSAPSMDPSSRYGKHLWVKMNLNTKDNPIKTKLILARREKKRNYSGKNRILIDDRPDNINEWVYEGGIGILHTSAQQTINDLKELGL